MNASQSSNNKHALLYNQKVEVTRRNIARLMGVEPDKFTSEEFKLSLIYLLPSDIQKKEYRPNFPDKKPVKKMLDILLEYHGKDSIGKNWRKKALHGAGKVRDLIMLVEGMIGDAEERVKELPGLEMFIDRSEQIHLEENQFEKIAPVTGDISSGCVEEVGFKSEEGVESQPDVPTEVPDIDDYSMLFTVFPFQPQETGHSVTDKTLQLQFNKLNSLIGDRPDLIKMYLPYLILRVKKYDASGFVQEGGKRMNFQESSVSHQKNRVSRQGNHNDYTQTEYFQEEGINISTPVFRAKKTRVFNHHSVVTTMIPGSGIITVDGKSYLDFFQHVSSRMLLIMPLRLSGTLGVFDIDIQVDQTDPEDTNALARCMAMSIADCVKCYSPKLHIPRGERPQPPEEPRVVGSRFEGSEERVVRDVLSDVYVAQFRKEYKKAGKRGPRARYTWRKR